jgi:hypothetical protein
LNLRAGSWEFVTNPIFENNYQNFSFIFTFCGLRQRGSKILPTKMSINKVKAGDWTTIQIGKPEFDSINMWRMFKDAPSPPAIKSLTDAKGQVWPLDLDALGETKNVGTSDLYLMLNNKPLHLHCK